jgi:hypothetical protein
MGNNGIITRPYVYRMDWGGFYFQNGTYLWFVDDINRPIRIFKACCGQKVLHLIILLSLLWQCRNSWPGDTYTMGTGLSVQHEYSVWADY